MNEINKYNEIIFEQIKHIDEHGNEYWTARELQKVLNYSQWRRFEETINRAKKSCEGSNYNIYEHFANAGKTSQMPNGGVKEITDYNLSRYACYLIVQNGDPRKKIIALGQTYFAVQTRKQELLEQEYDSLDENEKRFYQRKLTKKGNHSLQQIASKVGVKNMAEFHNAGYKGLYDGETADDIFKRKKLRYREDILDNMCEDELVANLFRITQAKQKLVRDNVQSENTAKEVHYEVGRKVRKAIADIGGKMPEEMPTPVKSLRKLEKENKNLKIK